MRIVLTIAICISGVMLYGQDTILTGKTQVDTLHYYYYYYYSLLGGPQIGGFYYVTISYGLK